MIYFSTLLISMFITISLMPFFRRMAIRLNAMDIPDARKVHPLPIPKCGGIAMAVGALIPIILWAPGGPFEHAILIGAGIVTIFGLIDDFTDLRYGTKFIGQIIAALIVIFYGGLKIKCLGTLLPGELLIPDWFAIVVTLVVIVGVTNAINLSDGLDGLAGGICLLSFICIGYLAYRCEDNFIAVLSIAVVGAIFGFLRFNTFPASLFMGDAGSQLLGFLAVTLSLGLTQGNTPYSPILPLILLGFPVLDTLVVMFERISEGRSPFVADKKHFHHKLMRLGLYHRESVLTIYVIQCLLVTAAFVFRFYSDWFLLLLYIVFAGVIIFGFTLTNRTGWQFKRKDFVDTAVKGRLKKLKERNIPIKVSFRAIQTGVPLLLIFSCILPENIPFYVSFISLAFVVLFFVVRLLRKGLVDNVISVSLYLFIPFVIYLGERDMVAWMNNGIILAYNLAFGVMAVFVFLTLRFTRRKHGFEITPMHFLILFFALVVPNLPDQWIQAKNMGMLAAKVIVLFFSFEVLIGELRGKTKKLWWATTVAVMIMGVRGIIN